MSPPVPAPSPRLRLHDSLSATLVPLSPRRPGEVRIYACGPTTYDVAHIGHARAAIAPDILVRHLRYVGLRVTYVRNITDVDDKVLKRAEQEGVPPIELSARMARLYQEDVGALACVVPDVEPKVSEHIPEESSPSSKSSSKGGPPTPSTWRAGLGTSTSRYVPSMATESSRSETSRTFGWARASNRRTRSATRSTSRCGRVLWATPGGGTVLWGKGRPGWHIECSAMSERYLGHGFDVHAGGMDLVFPHHENEIAQSEAAHPGEGPMASIWIHNGFVNIDKEKMSKSLGNFVTIRDVLARNDPEALRYFLLSVHYKGPIAFDTEKLVTGRVVFPGVIEAERRVDYLYQAVARLCSLGGTSESKPADAAPTPLREEAPAKLSKELSAFLRIADGAEARVDAALDDDLNTPVALAVVNEVAKTANELADLVQRRKKDAQLATAAPFVATRLLAALRATTKHLGVLEAPSDVYRERTQKQRLTLLGTTAEDIARKLLQRNEARRAKDYARADTIRQELERLNVEVADSPEGTSWRVGFGAPPPPPSGDGPIR